MTGVVTPELFDAAAEKACALPRLRQGSEPGDHPMSRVMEETELVNLVIYPCFGANARCVQGQCDIGILDKDSEAENRVKWVD